MFWSTEAFELTGEEDMQYFPLRSLLAEEEEREDIHWDRELTRQMTQYYDAKSNVKDMEIERWESIEGIHQLFETHDEVRKVYRECVGQIVQVVRLTPKQSSEGSAPKPESIVVANCHLFYHPMADHIRVLQAYAVCHKLDEIRREGLQADPVLIVGDFNSSPLSGKESTAGFIHHNMNIISIFDLIFFTLLIRSSSFTDSQVSTSVRE